MLISSHLRTPAAAQSNSNDRSVPKFQKNAKNKNLMRRLLSQGVPFVMDDIRLRGTYDPKYFANKYYDEPCKIHLETGKVKKTTVGQFFSTFGDVRQPADRAKLKVFTFRSVVHFFA